MINNYTTYNSSQNQIKDYQTALYNSLEKKGVLDQLKTQIRANLIKTFHDDKQLSNQSSKFIRSQLEEYDFTKVKAMKSTICLVKDFLESFNMSHTLSVFLVEIGFKDTEFYSDGELKEILFRNNTTLGNLYSQDSNPWLIKLLNAVQNLNSKSFNNEGCQTNQLSSTTGLDEKLAEIDKKHFSTILNLDNLIP